MVMVNAGETPTWLTSRRASREDPSLTYGEGEGEGDAILHVLRSRLTRKSAWSTTMKVIYNFGSSRRQESLGRVYMCKVVEGNEGNDLVSGPS